RILLAAAIFVLVYLLLVLVTIPSRINLEVGRPSPKTIYAPRDVVDEHATEMLRRAAEEAVPEVFDYQPEVAEEALAAVKGFFKECLDLQGNAELPQEEKVKALREEGSFEGLADSVLLSLLTADPGTVQELQRRLEDTLTKSFEEGIKANELEAAWQEVSQAIALFPYSADLKRISEKLVEPLIRPNLILNQAATQQNREKARQAVEPVVLLRGTLIISEGETVTEKHLAQLESLGLLKGGSTDYPAYIGLFLFLLVVFVMVGIYLSIFVKNVFKNAALILLLGIVVLVTLIFAIAATYFSGFLIPVSIGVLLIAVMFGARLALIMNVVFALMVALVTGGDFVYFAVALCGGLAAIYGVSRVSQRGDLAKAGLYVAGANTATIIAVLLIFGNLSVDHGSLAQMGYGLLAGIGNGIFSSVVAIGLLPYLESGFGITTAITLLELSDPNRPLLRQLLTKAPGTYYHSIMVGNLAEAAAEAVGADPLLTRVAAYYHDIGKMKRPYFFIENQLSGENPHDKITPNLSALIISAHVKDGVELGRKYRLPPVILDIISQHHGTSLISFFYQQALENNQKRDTVSMDQFRYEGPLPQTQEAAIIMLADAVEAGVRSMTKPTSNRIEGLIRKVIKEKLADGQMDECNLTLKDLDQIGDAFVYIMSGIYHSRIEYPEKDLRAEVERSAGSR
ncbi:MAG: HDIG domain-containing metalloprotein, partial [Dethiobacteria bacterium]